MLNKAISLAVVLLASAGTFADDFQLNPLPQAAHPTYDLRSVAKKMSYYDFMHSILAPAIKAAAPAQEKGGAFPNERTDLTADKGISVKLSEHNYNVHVDFPDGKLGGRSYGWTSGQVGDWSDKMYLDNLSNATTTTDTMALSAFYQSIVDMLGACNSDDGSSSVDGLKPLMAERVATNFLAIYTAEQYRTIVNGKPLFWDDAIFQVTMLAAFHGGQTKVTKFYMGEFTSESQVQKPGVYSSHGTPPLKGTPKTAALDDYWQDSAKADSKQGGINETRGDFEAMGEAITSYEANNATMQRIQGVVGKNNNVIKAISMYFVSGESKDLGKVEPLAADVAAFMVQIHDDAEKITAAVANQKQDQDQAGQDQEKKPKRKK